MVVPHFPNASCQFLTIFCVYSVFRSYPSPSIVNECVSVQRESLCWSCPIATAAWGVGEAVPVRGKEEAVGCRSRAKLTGRHLPVPPVTRNLSSRQATQVQEKYTEKKRLHHIFADMEKALI